MILFEKFSFTHFGNVSIALSSVVFTSTLAPPDPSRLGFFLLSDESLVQVLIESETNPNFCVLDSHYILSLFTFKQPTQSANSSNSFSSFNQSFPVTAPNEYSLFFANCQPECRVTMTVRTEIYNFDGANSDYLSAGQTQLPSLYFFFSAVYFASFLVWVTMIVLYLYETYNFDDADRDYLSAGQTQVPIIYFIFSAVYFAFFGVQITMVVRTEIYNFDGADRDYLSAGQTQIPIFYYIFSAVYFAFIGVWVYVCFKNKLPVHRIHLLMGAVILMKALNLICAAADKHYVKVTGTPHGWDVLLYIFQFIRVTLLFTVIVLIRTGWSFLKPFLQEREKKVLMIVIPLQVIANVASVVIGETGPFIKDWVTWSQVFLLIDIVCCGAIIFPIVWLIRSLRETSKTDGKAARNLAKLTLFRQFYIVVIGYLYFTRIVVFALRTIAAYKHQGVSNATEEIASLAFYLVMFYMFQPVEKNKYFVLEEENKKAAQQILQDEEFEL